MADDDRLMYFDGTLCPYCGKIFEAWIPKKDWDSGKAMAKCGVCPLPTLLNPYTVQVLPTLVNPDTIEVVNPDTPQVLPTLVNPDTIEVGNPDTLQTNQSSPSTSSTSNIPPSPEMRKPSREDYFEFVREETPRVKAANPRLNDKQAGHVARRNWATKGYDFMRRRGMQ